jgi:hypothetical protein
MTAESSLPELLRLYDIYSDKKFSEIVASRGKVVTSYSGDSSRPSEVLTGSWQHHDLECPVCWMLTAPDLLVDTQPVPDLVHPVQAGRQFCRLLLQAFLGPPRGSVGLLNLVLIMVCKLLTLPHSKGVYLQWKHQREN